MGRREPIRKNVMMLINMAMTVIIIMRMAVIIIANKNNKGMIV